MMCNIITWRYGLVYSDDKQLFGLFYLLPCWDLSSGGGAVLNARQDQNWVIPCQQNKRPLAQMFGFFYIAKILQNFYWVIFCFVEGSQIDHFHLSFGAKIQEDTNEL